MPVHDWTRVPAGIFRHFRNSWRVAMCDRLNGELLADSHYALLASDAEEEGAATPGTDLDRSLPRHRTIALHRADDHRVVSRIEILGPDQKSSAIAFFAFRAKVLRLLASGIHLLILDILPRGPRDPQGIPGAIWTEIGGPPITLAPERPLTLTSFEANGTARAFIETRAVGSELPTMPLFLEPGGYVNAALEETYVEAYQHVPRHIRADLERAV